MNAEIFFRIGRLEDAVKSAREAIEFARECGGLYAEGMSRRTLGAALVRLGDASCNEGEESFRASIKAFEFGGALVEAARTLRLWALLCSERGRKAEARSLLLRVADKFEAFALPVEHESIKQMIGELT